VDAINNQCVLSKKSWDTPITRVIFKKQTQPKGTGVKNSGKAESQGNQGGGLKVHYLKGISG